MDKEDLLDLKGNITFTLVAGGMIYLIYFIYQFLLPSSACFRDAKKAKKLLKWEPQKDINFLIKEMIEAEYKLLNEFE